jgi:integrase
MKGIRGALVLLPPEAGADASISAFEQWLRSAGWDEDLLLLQPRSTHETLGWKDCAVDACDRPAWGLTNGGLCEGCSAAWYQAGRPDRVIFDRQPPKRHRVRQHLTPCLVTRNGVRCGRNAQNRGLCGPHSYTVTRSKRDSVVVIAELSPLPSLGPCRVASCDRLAHLPGERLCKAHHNRWRPVRRANPRASLDDWCRTEKPVADSRRVAFAGIHPHVVRQILFGVFARSRRGSRTRLDHLQRLVDWVRYLQPTDLRSVRGAELPKTWTRTSNHILNTILVTVEYGDLTPEDFRHADVWPGVVFGKTGQVNFRDISQGWLRDITQAWCWDNLNRYDHFTRFGHLVNEIGYFSEYLRANVAGGGDDIAVLDRSTLTGFAAFLATVVQQGTERHRNLIRPVAWSQGLQGGCLLAVQRILRYGRETGRMDQFAGSFMLTDDLLVRRPEPQFRDDVGAALPMAIVRQLFSAESIAALRALNEQMPALLRIAAETGRRPGEFTSLKYDCIDMSAGGPFLIFTETKVTAGQERKLPVLSAVIDVVREQQTRVRAQYPHTDPEHLRLFPRPTMNPHGYHPLPSSTFGATLRTWVDSLPQLDSTEIGEDGHPLPFDRALICGYSFRHTYAQRHADAGTQPDVLMQLMGHEKISTTMGYYRIPQKRRRQAAELVGNLVIEGEHLTIGPVTHKHLLADERATIAVPFGKCSNPQNVAAEGHGCPIRHRCFGCASFSSDPSYLPEMRRRLLDLKATRARIDAFEGAADWAKRDARPSDEEIEALQQRIRVEEDKLARATPQQRALIEDASITLRKARAAAQVDITLHLCSPCSNATSRTAFERTEQRSGSSLLLRWIRFDLSSVVESFRKFVQVSRIEFNQLHTDFSGGDFPFGQVFTNRIHRNSEIQGGLGCGKQLPCWNRVLSLIRNGFGVSSRFLGLNSRHGKASPFESCAPARYGGTFPCSVTILASIDPKNLANSDNGAVVDKLPGEAQTPGDFRELANVRERGQQPAARAGPVCGHHILITRPASSRLRKYR